MNIFITLEGEENDLKNFLKKFRAVNGANTTNPNRQRSGHGNRRSGEFKTRSRTNW